MRLRTVLSIAVFVALAACDSKGPPQVGANQPAPGAAVTMPVTPPQLAAGPSCPDPAEIIAKACPPAKVAKAPAKPVKVRHVPPRKKAPVRIAARPAAPREYAPVVAPPAAPREYARVEAPPVAAPQRRVVEEEVRETWRTYGAPSQSAPPQQAYAPPPPQNYQPPPQAYYAPPQQYAPPPQQYYAPPAPAYAYAPPRGPCCTYPAAGRDANGFLTWPGKR